jgi:hypothetical protein
MVKIVGSSRGEVVIMQGCRPAEEYGSLTSVQGCLDLISAFHDRTFAGAIS